MHCSRRRRRCRICSCHCSPMLQTTPKRALPRRSMMAKPDQIPEVILFRVTLAVTAEQLPQVHKAVERLAALVDIQHWYDPEPLGVAPQADAPAMGDVPGTNAKLVYQRPSLGDEILRLAPHPGGVILMYHWDAPEPLGVAPQADAPA